MNALERYEYPSPIKISSNAGIYFAIPSSIIMNKDIGDKRATAFSFFSIRRGIDCELTFSINNIIRWTNREPNRHTNGINNKFMNAIEKLNDKEYITLYDKVTNSSCSEAHFNLDKILKECEYDRFAIIYLDEVEKIFNYSNHNSKDSFFNNDIMFLVFAYLRMMIFRRRNMLLPEETNLNNKCDHEYDVNMRRLKSPEAYDCYYYEIAEDLGISTRMVSKSVAALNDMGLIYYEQLPRTKINGKWVTEHTIFCNYYKREKGYLLTSGKEYYLLETHNKKKKLNIINKQGEI